MAGHLKGRRLIVKCFLSYHAADRPWAEWIAWHLELAGHSVSNNQHLAPRWVDAVAEAVHVADLFIVVMSSHFADSRWLKQETQALIASNTADRVLPVRVSQETPDMSWLPEVAVDITDVPESEAVLRLLAAVHNPTWQTQTRPPFPGQPWQPVPTKLPRVWHMPHARNPNFVGRSEALSRLQSWLPSSSKHIATVTGRPGVGKTSLAVEYVYRQASAYDLVWWIDAHEPLAVPQQVAALASAQGFGGTAVSLTAWDSALRWFAEHYRCLLVLDGLDEVDSLPSFLPSFLPPGGGVHVLITTRQSSHIPADAHLVVDPWQPDEAEEFLYSRNPSIGDGAKELGRNLAFHPLALELAAAFTEETGTSVHDLTHQLQQQSRVQKEALPVDRMWERVQHRLHPRLLEWARLLAYMSPSAASPLLLQSGKAGDKLARKDLNHTMALLRRWSLASAADGRIYMPAALQAAIRAGVEKHQEQNPVHDVVRTLTAAWNAAKRSADGESVASRLLPHALAVVRHVERLQCVGEETAVLLNLAGMHLLEQSAPTPALHLFMRALDHLSAAPTVAGTRAAIQLNYGSALLREGSVADAEVQFRAVVSSGDENPDLLVRAWNGLALTAERTDRLEEAAHAFQMALRYVPPGSGAVGILQSLARVRADAGAYREALESLEHARALDPRDFTLITDEAALLIEMEEYERAMTLLHDGLRLVPPDNVRAITMREGLADLAMKLGNTADALIYYVDALQAADAQLGPDHPYVAQLKESIQDLKGGAMP